MDYELLIPFISHPRQEELLRALIDEPGLSVSAAARKIGMVKTHACRAIRRLKAKAHEELPIRQDYYCPECGAAGMLSLDERAENGRIRHRCTSCGFETVRVSRVPLAPALPRISQSDIAGCSRFLITSAVNNTPIDPGTHAAFRTCAESLGAHYLIVPSVYRNPDLKHEGIMEGYTWPEEIHPYVCPNDLWLNDHLVIRAESRIQYTVVNPLAGMNHAGGITSEIFGHPQVAMQLVPTAKPLLPKLLHTTGTISQPNYGGSQRAHKARFHHSYSALLIEIEGDKFWFTQVHYDGKGAQVFDTYYTPKGAKQAPGLAGIVYGDTHVRYLEPNVDRQLTQVAEWLKPQFNVYHDVHDHHINSHHSEQDILFHLSCNAQKEHSIRAELQRTADFFATKQNVVLIDSNHHDHLCRWFNRCRPAMDPVNVDLYFELGEAARLDILNGGDGNLLRLFLDRYCETPITYVDPNTQFEIAGIDCAQHGHRGPNGSRGGARGFAATGHKTVIGHSHTPAIEKGCYQVGTSAEGMPYARGFSSWLNTHCMIYPNGKRGLFSLIDGELSPLMRSCL